MNKYVPLEKQTKRKQKEFYAAQRRDWGCLNPTTKKSPNLKAYNRKKSKHRHEYEPMFGFFGCFASCDFIIGAIPDYFKKLSFQILSPRLPQGDI